LAKTFEWKKANACGCVCGDSPKDFGKAVGAHAMTKKIISALFFCKKQT
jgi:hypothetical protein